MPSHLGLSQQQNYTKMLSCRMGPRHSQGLQESFGTTGQKLGEFLASASKSRIISPSQEGPWSRGDPWVADTQCLRKTYGRSAARLGTESGFCVSGSSEELWRADRAGTLRHPTASTIRCQFLFRGRKVEVHARFPWPLQGPPQTCCLCLA